MAPINVIDRVLAELPRSPRRLTELTGMKMTPEAGSSTSYETRGPALIDGIAVDRIEFRKSPSADGAFVVLTFGVTHCLRRTEVLERYKPLELWSVPRPNADEEYVYGRREAWGEINFGFAVTQEDCLRTMSMSFENSA